MTEKHRQASVEKIIFVCYNERNKFRKGINL